MRTWHAMDQQTLWQETGSGEQGLRSNEIPHRIERFGRNTLEAPEGTSAIKTLIHQLHNPLIYLLIGAAALSLATGHTIDAVVILAVIILNTMLGAIQEWKADRAMEALHDMTVPHARVMRNGRSTTVSSEEVVPGDVLLLETGDRIPADARVVSAVELHADESALTGESEQVHKTPGEVPENAQPADRTNMVWMSSAVTQGNGMAVVVNTGMNTQLGKIAGAVRRTERGKTPLQKRLSKLGLVLGLSGVGLSVLIFFLGLLKGHGVTDMALFAVAVAVSAIPEGLPAVISVTLALGVQRMAGRNAVIRTLPAVETLGSTTVICSDKTGTITRNEMTVTHIWTSTGDATVSTEGLETDPETPDISLLLRTGVLGSKAVVTEDGSVSGPPTESAIAVASVHCGLPVEALRIQHPRIHEIPFSSTHKYMAALCGNKAPVLYAKGAPDRVLDFCDRIMVDGTPEPMTDSHREAIENAIEDYGEQALRVVAGAMKTMPARTRSVQREDAENGLVFVGLWGMVDPPRTEAIAAVADAKQAGIRVVMITGDHAVTALAIASSVGIASKGDRVVTGEELDSLSDEELDRTTPEVSVYARVSPEHKLRILKSLKRAGEIVAMTGDGVNDAPALKGADIGISMGQTGTEVAREASDMILTDDNFATIVHAVEEGRTIFANLRRVVFFLITTNLGEILTLAAGLMLGLPIPLTAVMILWINLVTDGACTIPLGIEPGHGGVLKVPPRRPESGVLNRGIMKRILLLAPVMAAGTLWLFERELGNGEVHARTMAFAVLAAFQWFQALNSRSLSSSLFSVGVFGNRWLWVGILISVGLQVLVTQTGIGQSIFGLTALSPANWGTVVLVASSVFIVDELLKLTGIYGGEKALRA